MTNAPQFFFLGLGHGEGGESPYELLEVHGAAGVSVQDVHHALEEGGWERVEGMGEGGGLHLDQGVAPQLRHGHELLHVQGAGVVRVQLGEPGRDGGG